MTAPLDAAPAGPRGVKVLDFCSFIAGAYGAMSWETLGAEVIKVEPLTGDLARGWGPFLAGESRWFQGWNRNKRGLASTSFPRPARRSSRGSSAKRTWSSRIPAGDHRKTGHRLRSPARHEPENRLLLLDGVWCSGPLGTGRATTQSCRRWAVLPRATRAFPARSPSARCRLRLPSGHAGRGGRRRGTLPSRANRPGPKGRDVAVAGNHVGTVTLLLPGSGDRGRGPLGIAPLPPFRDQGRTRHDLRRHGQSSGAFVCCDRGTGTGHRPALRHEPAPVSHLPELIDRLVPFFLQKTATSGR